MKEDAGIVHKSHFNHNYKNEEGCWREPIWAYHTQLALPGEGRGEGGRRESAEWGASSLGLGFNIPDEMLIQMTVPVVRGLLRTPL